eukprot:jgi/Mesvir1/25966/Mv20953-RA.1
MIASVQVRKPPGLDSKECQLQDPFKCLESLGLQVTHERPAQGADPAHRPLDCPDGTDKHGPEHEDMAKCGSTWGDSAGTQIGDSADTLLGDSDTPAHDQMMDNRGLSKWPDSSIAADTSRNILVGHFESSPTSDGVETSLATGTTTLAEGQLSEPMEVQPKPLASGTSCNAAAQKLSHDSSESHPSCENPGHSMRDLHHSDCDSTTLIENDRAAFSCQSTGSTQGGHQSPPRSAELTRPSSPRAVSIMACHMPGGGAATQGEPGTKQGGQAGPGSPPVTVASEEERVLDAAVTKSHDSGSAELCGSRVDQAMEEVGCNRVTRTEKEPPLQTRDCGNGDATAPAAPAAVASTTTTAATSASRLAAALAPRSGPSCLLTAAMGSAGLRESGTRAAAVGEELVVEEDSAGEAHGVESTGDAPSATAAAPEDAAVTGQSGDGVRAAAATRPENAMSVAVSSSRAAGTVNALKAGGGIERCHQGCCEGVECCEGEQRECPAASNRDSVDRTGCRSSATLRGSAARRKEGPEEVGGARDVQGGHGQTDEEGRPAGDDADASVAELGPATVQLRPGMAVGVAEDTKPVMDVDAGIPQAKDAGIPHTEDADMKDRDSTTGITGTAEDAGNATSRVAHAGGSATSALRADEDGGGSGGEYNKDSGAAQGDGSGATAMETDSAEPGGGYSLAPTCPGGPAQGREGGDGGRRVPAPSAGVLPLDGRISHLLAEAEAARVASSSRLAGIVHLFLTPSALPPRLDAAPMAMAAIQGAANLAAQFMFTPLCQHPAQADHPSDSSQHATAGAAPNGAAKVATNGPAEVAFNCPTGVATTEPAGMASVPGMQGAVNRSTEEPPFPASSYSQNDQGAGDLSSHSMGEATGMDHTGALAPPPPPPLPLVSVLSDPESACRHAPAAAHPPTRGKLSQPLSKTLVEECQDQLLAQPVSMLASHQLPATSASSTPSCTGKRAMATVEGPVGGSFWALDHARDGPDGAPEGSGAARPGVYEEVYASPAKKRRLGFVEEGAGGSNEERGAGTGAGGVDGWGGQAVAQGTDAGASVHNVDGSARGRRKRPAATAVAAASTNPSKAKTPRAHRGLPIAAVEILRAWLFDHFCYPYPKQADKKELAKKVGLSPVQVSNWFINARVRLWRPLIKDIARDPDMREEAEALAAKRVEEKQSLLEAKQRQDRANVGGTARGGTNGGGKQQEPLPQRRAAGSDSSFLAPGGGKDHGEISNTQQGSTPRKFGGVDGPLDGSGHRRGGDDGHRDNGHHAGARTNSFGQPPASVPTDVPNRPGCAVHAGHEGGISVGAGASSASKMSLTITSAMASVHGRATWADVHNSVVSAGGIAHSAEGLLSLPGGIEGSQMHGAGGHGGLDLQAARPLRSLRSIKDLKRMSSVGPDLCMHS